MAATPIVDGILAETWPFSPDGVHTLRLTVTDAVGQKAVALTTVTVDTVPPGAPIDPQAEVLDGAGGPGTADVALSWTEPGDPDVAGYRVSREGGPSADVTDTQLVDASVPEGEQTYSIVAVDHAGNESAPAVVTVRVDRTPPTVDLRVPATGDVVSGSVEVRGTAFSPDDFAEYRLLVGAGTDPPTFVEIARGGLPVSAGALGSWDALDDGPHVLALEAEDTSGNIGRTTVAVSVDTVAPDAPVLTDVSLGALPDSLTATWTESLATDVAGYLVRCNDRIANAPGLVIGDVDAFLVSPPSISRATPRRRRTGSARRSSRTTSSPATPRRRRRMCCAGRGFFWFGFSSVGSP